MSVAHSLVTQHALTSHALSLHCLQPLRHGKGHLCAGHVSDQRLQNLVSSPWTAHLRNIWLTSINEELESAWLRKGQADGGGGQGSQTIPRLSAWTMHHVKLHQLFQTFPWKYDIVPTSKRKIVRVSFYVLSNGAASEATQGPLPEIRVLFRGTFVFRATFLRDLAMSTPNPGSWYSCPKWRHKSHKHRVEPSLACTLHRASWLAA